MKIKKIYISAFGGLKDFSMDFSDGFNTVFGENENGKSTVMSFIKMMFYGSSTASGLKNMRNRYNPWDGSDMAGSITFEHSGRMFRLEREFKKSNSTDKVVLFDIDMGAKQVVASDIGTVLFGLSAGAFEHSIFIGSAPDDNIDKSTEGEINAKLSNLSSSGNESVSFTEIFSRIENARLSLNSKSGKAGILDKNRIKLKEYEDSFVAGYEEIMHIKALKEKEKQLCKEISELEATANKLKTELSRANDVKNSEKLKELLSIKAELDELNKGLALKNGKFIDELFVRSIMFSIGKIENTEQKLLAKTDEEKLLKSNLEILEHPSEDMNPENAQKISDKLAEIHQNIENCENDIKAKKERISELQKELSNAQSTKKSIGIPLLIPGILLALVSVVLLILKLNTFAFIGFTFGILAIILSITIKKIDKSLINRLNASIADNEKLLSELNLGKESLITEEKSLKEKRDLINSVLNNNTALIEKQRDALKDCSEQILALLSAKNEETEKLLGFYSNYKSACDIEEIKAELEKLSDAASKQKELKQQLNYIAKDLDNISYEEAQLRLNELNSDDITSADLTELSSSAEEIVNTLNAKKSELAALCTEIRFIEKNTPNPDEISAKIMQLKEIISAQNEFCEYSKIAMDILTDSFAEFRRSYGSQLEQDTTEIFKGLTAGKYSNVSISKSFDVTVEKANTFGTKEIDYLSSGTKDQVYLSMRLALAKLMSDKDLLPIFLDDSLDRYDDSRTVAALNFLKEFAKDSQIIMFTCHSFIAEKSRELNANVVNISK